MLKESRALHIVQYPSCTCEVTWCSAAVVSYKRSKTKIKRVASFFYRSFRESVVCHS